MLRGLGDSEKIAEEQCAHENGKDRSGGAECTNETIKKLRSRKPPSHRRNQESTPRTHAGCLGRSKNAAVKPADNEEKQKRNRPNTAHGLPPLGPPGALSLRKISRANKPDQGNSGKIHRHREQPRNDACDVKLADVLLRDEAIDREHQGRR